MMMMMMKADCLFMTRMTGLSVSFVSFLNDSYVPSRTNPIVLHPLPFILPLSPAFLSSLCIPHYITLFLNTCSFLSLHPLFLSWFLLTSSFHLFILHTHTSSLSVLTFSCRAPSSSPVENKSQWVKSLDKTDVFGSGWEAVCSDGSRAHERRRRQNTTVTHLSVFISAKFSCNTTTQRDWEPWKWLLEEKLLITATRPKLYRVTNNWPKNNNMLYRFEYCF